MQIACPQNGVIGQQKPVQNITLGKLTFRACLLLMKGKFASKYEGMAFKWDLLLPEIFASSWICWEWGNVKTNQINTLGLLWSAASDLLSQAGKDGGGGHSVICIPQAPQPSWPRFFFNI